MFCLLWVLGSTQTMDPTGQFMAACTEYTFSVGSAREFTLYQTVQIPFATCSQIIWNPDSDKVAVIGGAHNEGIVYSFPAMEYQYRIPAPPVWHPEGSMFAYRNDSAITVMNGTDHLWSIAIVVEFPSIHWSPDGVTLGTSNILNGSIILLWGLNGTERRVFNSKEKTTSFAWISSEEIMLADDNLSIANIVSGNVTAEKKCDCWNREACCPLERMGSLINEHTIFVYDTLSLSWVSKDMEWYGRNFPFPVGMACGSVPVRLTRQPGSLNLLTLDGALEPHNLSGSALFNIESGMFTQIPNCSFPTYSSSGRFLAMICSTPSIPLSSSVSVMHQLCLRVFNMSRQAMVRAVMHREWALDSGAVNLTVAWINDDYLITVVDGASTITIFDVVRMSIVNHLVSDSLNLVASFPGDGNFLVATSASLQVWNYDSRSNKLNRTQVIHMNGLQQDGNLNIAISSLGKVAVASNRTVIVWNGTDAVQVHRFSLPCIGNYISLSWAFDNTTLAYACNSLVTVWRQGQYEKTQSFPPVFSLAWRKGFPMQLAISTVNGITLWRPSDIILHDYGIMPWRGQKGVTFEIEGRFLDTTGSSHGIIKFDKWNSPAASPGVKAEWIEKGKKLRSPPLDVNESLLIDVHGERQEGYKKMYLSWDIDGTGTDPSRLRVLPVLTWPNLCEPGYGATDSQCVLCPSDPGSKIAGGALAFLAYTVVQSYLILRKQDETTSLNSQLLGVLASTAQLHIISLSKDPSFAAMKENIQAVAIPASTQGGFFSFAATHCFLAGMSVEHVQRVKLMLMTFTPVMLYFGSRVLLCAIRRRSSSHKISVVFAVYAWSNLNSMLIMTQLKFVKCLEVSDSEMASPLWVTAIDPLEDCNQPSHTQWMWLGVAPGFLYLLIPLYAGTRNRRNNCLSFMVVKFKVRKWIVMQYLRNPALAALFLFTSDKTQIWIPALIWLTPHLVGTLINNPYGSRLCTLLDAWSIVSGVCFAFRHYYPDKDGRNIAPQATARLFRMSEAIGLIFYFLMLIAFLWVNCRSRGCQRKKEVPGELGNVTNIDSLNSFKLITEQGHSAPLPHEDDNE